MTQERREWYGSHWARSCAHFQVQPGGGTGQTKTTAEAATVGRGGGTGEGVFEESWLMKKREGQVGAEGAQEESWF
jgi:hypothetical protein